MDSMSKNELEKIANKLDSVNPRAAKDIRRVIEQINRDSSSPTSLADDSVGTGKVFSPNATVEAGLKVVIAPADDLNTMRARSYKGSRNRRDGMLWGTSWRVKEVKEAGSEESDPGSSTVAVLTDGPEGFDKELTVPVEDIVPLVSFDGSLYPGFSVVDQVVTNKNKPSHVVISGDNTHSLQALKFSHRGKIDVAYMKVPDTSEFRPYDSVRRSIRAMKAEAKKAELERLNFIRVNAEAAKHLMARSSVVLFSVDSRKSKGVRATLEDVFPNARLRTITAKTEATEQPDDSGLVVSSTVVYCVMLGNAAASKVSYDASVRSDEDAPGRAIWSNIKKKGEKSTRYANPSFFYPVYVDNDLQVVHVGDMLIPGLEPGEEDSIDGATAVYPMREDGSQGCYVIPNTELRDLVKREYVKVVKEGDSHSIFYVNGIDDKLSLGLVRDGVDQDGFPAFRWGNREENMFYSSNIWNNELHNSESYGRGLTEKFAGTDVDEDSDSLYLVEDLLRLFTSNNKNAVILDMDARAGVCCHAVMRLNAQDCGKRSSVSIARNELPVHTQELLLKKGVSPGDNKWESCGVCEGISYVRLSNAVAGYPKALKGIEGADKESSRNSEDVSSAELYEGADHSPVSMGFAENVVLLRLSYLSLEEAKDENSFELLAPIMWMKSGANAGVPISRDNRWYTLEDSYVIVFDTKKINLVKSALSDMNCDPENPVDMYFLSLSGLELEDLNEELGGCVSAVDFYDTYFGLFGSPKLKS